MKPPLDGLEAQIEALVSEAVAAWPGLSIGRDRFVSYLAGRLPEGEEPAASLRELRAADLYLAAACAEGDPRAIEAFDAQLLGPTVEAAARRMGGGDRVLDDARQLVREQLLSPRPDGRRGIESYSGRGSLRGWLKVTVTRRLLRVLRRDRREVPISADELFDAISTEADGPELMHLKDRYRDAFKRAFESAIVALTPQERNLLRYQFVDGLGSHEIGAVYGVHRATASRWLVLARESLLERTRGALRAELGVASSEIDSIVELVRSRIDLSLRRLLAEEAP